VNAADKYCSDVLDGSIPSGLNLRNAVKRYLEDRKNGWVWREDQVEKVIKFIRKSKHFTGRHAGKPVKLEPWQAFIVANLYGFYNKDGSRRFQTAYLEMARKNGKTALAAELSFFSLKEEGEANAEVLLAANSKDQAHIDFKMVRGFVQSYDPDKKIYTPYRSDIVLKDGEGFIKTLAADADKLDGYNCSVGIVDEYHSAPNSQVRDVIRSSQGMRVNPLLITITTSGFDKSLPCYELRTVASEIAANIKQDDSFFSVIYSMDEGDDWKNERNWLKSNPNLDITISTDFLRKQVLQAINNPADEVGVKTKNLNMWCDTAAVWIQDDYILKATHKLKKEDFKGEDCYIGVDLSSNRDLTAVSYLFFRNEKYYFFVDYYLPRDSLKERPDKELYIAWHNHHYLKSTSGNVVDYDYILKDILEVSQNTNIIKIYYDKWNSLVWAVKSTEEGLPLEPFSQNIGNFNSPTKEFERLMLKGQVILDDNPITRYCLRCVELKFDFTGNCKPSKLNEKKKIDGVIAMLQALAAYMKESTFAGTGIY
jgi:phage terminase large subunit-like protein